MRSIPMRTPTSPVTRYGPILPQRAFATGCGNACREYQVTGQVNVGPSAQELSGHSRGLLFPSNFTNRDYARSLPGNDSLEAE
jgi:hypothetical protein